MKETRTAEAGAPAGVRTSVLGCESNQLEFPELGAVKQTAVWGFTRSPSQFGQIGVALDRWVFIHPDDAFQWFDKQEQVLNGLFGGIMNMSHLNSDVFLLTTQNTPEIT